MYNLNIVTYFTSLFWLQVVAESSEFGVTAPLIVCPKLASNSLTTSDIIITIEPEDNVELNITWSISWVPLKIWTQREILMLWRKTRCLQKKFNKQQSELLTFTIKDDELLTGVRYIFNITATSRNGQRTKTIPISYIQGHESIPHGNTDTALSAVLLSGKSTYIDMEFVIEAQITNCDTTLDYYLIWSVCSEIFRHSVNVTSTFGSRLEIPPYSLIPGATYEVSYQVVRDSNKEIITEVKSSFQVLNRGLKVYLNQDLLMVTVDTAFCIEALVDSRDYFEHNVKYDWKCYNKERICNFTDDSNEYIYNLSSGIPYEGEFTVSLTVTVYNESATANATIITSNADLPIIQIQPVRRIINENEELKLISKVHFVGPSCALSWYFVTEEMLKMGSDQDILEYGEVISDSVTKLSLNEKFLDEIVDFEYERKSIEVKAVVTKAGRAHLIANCETNNATNNNTERHVYAEVNFKLNRGPTVLDLNIVPESGTALETIFRIYSKAEDTEGPLVYSFYCAVGNSTLLLASYFDHWTVDTFLPYVDGGTDVWVVVCDSLGACSRSDIKTIQILPNNDINTELILKAMKGYIKRCDIQQFQRILISAIVSYKNAGQSELKILTKTVLESLPGLHSRCLSEARYFQILSELAAVGVNTNAI